MDQREKLKRIRAGGKARFIWFYGVMCFGLPCAILFAVAFQIVMHGFSLSIFVADNFLTLLIVSLVLWPVGGYVWGVLMWKNFMGVLAKIEATEK